MIDNNGNFSGSYTEQAKNKDPYQNSYSTSNRYEDPYSDQYSYQTNNGFYNPNPKPQNNTMAIVSMILGIVSLVCCCAYGLFGFIMSVVALVLGGIVLYKRMPGTGMAIAGIVTGIIGLLMSVIMVASMLGFLTSDNSNYDININGHHYNNWGEVIEDYNDGELDFGDFDLDDFSIDA